MTKQQFLDGIEPSVATKMLVITLEILSDHFNKLNVSLNHNSVETINLINDLRKEVMLDGSLRRKYNMLNECATVNCLIEFLDFARVYGLSSKIIEYAKYKYDTKMKRISEFKEQKAPLILMAHELNVAKNTAFAYCYLQSYFYLDKNNKFAKA